MYAVHGDAGPDETYELAAAAAAVAERAVWYAAKRAVEGNVIFRGLFNVFGRHPEQSTARDQLCACGPDALKTRDL